MRKLFTLIVCMLSACGVWAQQGEVPLTLDSCRAMALRNQAKVKNAALAVQAAQQTRKMALTKYFPTVSVAAGWFQSRDFLIDVDNNDIENSSNAQLNVEGTYEGETFDAQTDHLQRELDRLGIDIDLREEMERFVDRFAFDAHLQMLDHGLFANAMVTQPLFAGGRIVNGNRLAQLGVDVAELQLLMSRDEVELNVEESYWLVRSLDEKQQTVESFLQMLDTLERDATAANEAGILGRNDLLKVRLRRNELAAARTQISHGIRLATMSLCQQVGMAYDTAICYRLVDSLDAVNTYTLPLFSQPLDTLVAQRSEAQLLEMSVRAQSLQKAMALGEAMPQVAVGVTYGVNNLFGSVSDNAILFATVNIPVTAWWETAHNARKFELERQRAANDRDDLCQKMVLQTRQVIDAEVEAAELLAIRRQSLDEAREHLQESRNYYEAGLVSVSDYLEAQALLRQAQNDLIDQQVTLRMAQLRRQQFIKEIK